MRVARLATLLLLAAAAASGAAAQLMPMPLPPTSIASVTTGASILDPECIPKYDLELVLPPAMPATSRVRTSRAACRRACSFTRCSMRSCLGSILMHCCFAC